MTIFMLWECPTCGFDAVLSEQPERFIVHCPLCAEDNGRDQIMILRRRANPHDKPEGRDERAP